MEFTIFLSILVFFWGSVMAKPLDGRAVDPAADPTRASVLSVLATAIPSSARTVPTLAPGETPPAWYGKLPADVKSLLPILYPKTDGDVQAVGTSYASAADDCLSTTTITKTLTRTAVSESSTDSPDTTICTTTTSTTTLTLTLTATAPVGASSSSAPGSVTSSASAGLSAPTIPPFLPPSQVSGSAIQPSILPSLPPYTNLSVTAAPTGPVSGSSSAPSATFSSSSPAFTGSAGKVLTDFMFMGMLGAGGILLGLG